MKIILSNHSDLPIYEQIKEQIKAAILTGELAVETMLPSIRTLAKELKISAITTTKAYNDLEQEGFIKSMPGKGFFVLSIHTEMMKESLLRQIEDHFTASIQVAKMAGLTKTELLNILNLILEEESFHA